MAPGLMIDLAATSAIPKEGTLAASTVELPSNGGAVQPTIDHIVHVEVDGVPDVTPPAPQCPFTGMKIYNQAKKECDLIRSTYRTLAPTGCTPDFCQSGRMTRINEPRVGRDRPLSEIQQEAVDFLRECRDSDVIQTDNALSERIKEALVQISTTAAVSTVTDRDGNVSTGLAGGTWYQHPKELEYGLRASWRNARRCIMRSEHEHLALVDLRRVQSSREMARTIVKGVQKAFNRGHILPTTFVFPPRAPGKRGPMIWNHQIMAFAGYREDDGSILGDPGNVELTDRMIEFGWMPPLIKTRWDFLPLVTMAENDAPYMMELPAELRRTVQITHPRYEKEFRELSLQWVSAPALSRLGFDIGGNQYTASPFIGWFMDSEIGVRNLADTFRYNALPGIVRALGLSPEPGTDLEDLPEYMHMVALSRAQAELNFAVYYSYLHDHVTMVDTLSSSIEYMNFDQDRAAEVGFRLPADPYWLAPPQGSLVPLWHEGGAPNYQPKPMICRHVQDPIKAWHRETPAHKRSSQKGLIKTLAEANENRPRIRIFSCSAGVNAGKMAHRLHDKLERLVHEVDDPYEIEHEKALNQLNLVEAGPEDIILIIASTTGRGGIPGNAQKFVHRYESAAPLMSPPRFSCFANGDSTYGDSYNAAGLAIQQLMTKMGCRPLLGHCFAGDTAHHNPDWESFTHWLENIDHLILGNHYKIDLPTSLTEMQEKTTTLTEMPTATLTRVQRLHPQGVLQITLDIGDKQYKEMDHIKILAPNPDHEVEIALTALELSPNQALDWHHQPAKVFLGRYADLDHSFKRLDWYPNFTSLPSERQSLLKTAKAITILASEMENIPIDAALVESICKDMASIVPRLYSIASCPAASNTNLISSIAEEEEEEEEKEKEAEENGGLPTDTKETNTSNFVDIIVKVNPSGRFSSTFLLSASLGAQMRFSLTSPDTWSQIQNQKPTAPFIAICTGSGIGPVRALLQRRIIDLQLTTGESGRPRATKLKSVSIGAGTSSGSIYSSSPRGSVSSLGSNGVAAPQRTHRQQKAINHHTHLG
ncbi:MAG: hypothetical protein Q9204_004698, partial [Flavoplaca sp. TL-2023a]